MQVEGGLAVGAQGVMAFNQHRNNANYEDCGLGEILIIALKIFK